ncbi:MAG: protein-methionine-sulfoxide reductase catalytic subunit MsrP [Chromatiales bacterium]|nr:protein-methionine-sulfoxide reductase catalytic subunit MsrP [Chromatiales bacterium]
MLIKSKCYSTPLPSEITDETVYLNRRKFIKQSGAVAAGLSLTTYAKAALGPLDNLPDSRYNIDEELTDERSITTYNNFYELGYGKDDPHKNAKYLKTEPWSIAVDGECENPGVYSLEDFVTPHQLEDRIYRLRCVEAWSMVIPWVGFEVNQIIKKSKPTSRAKYVAFRSILDRENLPGQSRPVLDWPYKEGLRIDEAMNPLAIFVVGLYGKVLPNQNGAPLRLVVPWKYGFKSIKSIVAMEFTEQQPPTAWNLSAPQEYGFYSNVNPEVNHPRWSQKRERRIGEFRKRSTLMFNGYEEEVASLYSGMDLEKYF